MPTISGTATQSQTLTASNGTWSNSPTAYAYQWQDCTSSGCTNINGATSSSYALQASDVGDTIDVIVAASNMAGTTSATSVPTATVAAAPPPPPPDTALPAISGTATQSQTLTASNGTWSNSPTAYAYQWQDCTSSGCTNINGATSSSYALQASDVGDTIDVVVTASNAGGSTSAGSAQTATVAAAPPLPPVNTSLPAISGTATQSQTLTASSGTWSNSPTAYAYQWQACTSSGCTNITGATGSSYTVANTDVGDTLVTVVTAYNNQGSAAAASAPTGVVTSDGSMAPPAGYTSSQLAFDDQFTGTTLDASKWTAMLAGQGGAHWNNGGLPSGFSATGSTGETVYDPANVVINNGLSLNLDYNNTYSSLGYHTFSGAISTFNKFTFSSGYVQVRAKMPDTSQGQWPAIWLLPNGTPNGGSGGSEEIDMHEGGMAPGGYGWPNSLPINQSYAPNYHQPDNTQSLSLAGDTPPSDLSTSYHTYGMELIAGQSVKFYLDGVLMATQTVNITNEQWELIINLAEVASGVGLWHQPAPSDISTLPPSTMQVSEVQIYTLP